MRLNQHAEKRAGMESRIDGIQASRVELFLEHVKTDVNESKRKERVRKVSEMEEKIWTGIRTRELMEGELGLDENDGILNEEEQDSYKHAVKDYVKLQENERYGDACIVFMGMVKNKRIYKELYSGWKNDYEKKKAEDPVFAAASRDPEHFTRYMRDKSILYVQEVSRVLRSEKIEKTFIGESENISAEDQMKLKEVSEKVEMFIYDRRAELKSAKDEELDQLYRDFSEIFTEEDLQGVTEKSLRSLFDDLVTNVIFENLSIEEMDIVSGKMVQFVNSGMSQEEWDEMLAQELRDKAKGELKEYLVQSSSNVGSGTSIVFDAHSDQQLYEMVSPFTKKSMVFLSSVGDNRYRMRFGAFNDPNFTPTISLYPDRFVLHSDYADKEDQSFSYDDFTGIANAQILEHELISKPVKEANKSSIDINALISDSTMMRDLAEPLFGFSLNDRPLNKMHKEIFGRFMRILVGDQNGTLVERIKLFREYVNRDRENNSVKLMNVLRKEGSRINTMRTLIDMAESGLADRDRGVRVSS